MDTNSYNGLKYYDLGLFVKKSKQINLSYPTVLMTVHMIRLAIPANSIGDNLLKGEVEIDESYMDKKHKGKKGQSTFNEVSVFGIL